MKKKFKFRGVEFKHGSSVRFLSIYDEELIKDAKIAIIADHIYICHNNHDWIGTNIKNKFGYKYSYFIGEITEGLNNEQIGDISRSIKLERIMTYEDRQKEKIEAIKLLQKSGII